MGRLGDIPISFDAEAEYVPSNPRVIIFAWWKNLDPFEKVLYRGLAALSAGLAAVAWPLALIVPGAVITGLAVATYVNDLRRSGDG